VDYGKSVRLPVGFSEAVPKVKDAAARRIDTALESLAAPR
jgi:hypothetical protein